MEERIKAHAIMKLSALKELDRFDIESKVFGDLVRALFSQSAVENQKLDISQLSPTLNSLKVSLAGVLLDTFRANMQPEELQQRDNIVSCRLWERLQHLFPDIREQRLAFLLFHCNLSPSEILLYAPEEFTNKQEICHLRRKMLDRILQDSDNMH